MSERILFFKGLDGRTHFDVFDIEQINCDEDDLIHIAVELKCAGYKGIEITPHKLTKDNNYFFVELDMTSFEGMLIHKLRDEKCNGTEFPPVSHIISELKFLYGEQEGDRES